MEYVPAKDLSLDSVLVVIRVVTLDVVTENVTT